jgi:hypothetical protein
MTCEICNEDKRKGYKQNPRTGRFSRVRFWCDGCYERIVAITSGDHYRDGPIAETAIATNNYHRARPKNRLTRSGDCPTRSRGQF